MQETSLDAYEHIKPTIGLSQSNVLDCLKKRGVASNAELSRRLNKPINTITPRVNELRKKGLVVYVGKSVDPFTRMKVMLWKATNG